MPTLSDAHQLLQLLDITRESIHQIIGEWAKLSPKEEATLPSHKLFEDQRRVIAATGKLVELVSSPSSRLLEVSSQYNEARCLHIAATLRIPDILGKGGDEGVSIEDLAKDVGIEKRKLGELWFHFLHGTGYSQLVVANSICRRAYNALLVFHSHLSRNIRRSICKQRDIGSIGQE